MNTNEIINAQHIIDLKSEEIAKSINEKPVLDGIISPEDYINSTLKCLWLLREPTIDHADNIRSDINRRLDKGELKKNKYFDPMRHLIYSIDNNYIKNEDIKNTDYSSNLLKQIAFVNCSKIRGGSKLNWPIWRKNYDLFKDIVFKQIQIANPNIIICVGTIEFLNKNGYLKDAEKKVKSYRHYYLKENSIIFDCYHLAQRKITQNSYVNDIISVLKDLENYL